VGPNDTSRSQSGWAEHRRVDAQRHLPRRLIACLAIVAGLVLGACSIPFGPGADSTEPPPRETPRDRNRLYQQEQEQVERQYQFDRVGPSDR
jgi:outer membrane biogenesis lipoprotein LolB